MTGGEHGKAGRQGRSGDGRGDSWVVGGRAIAGFAASASQMGRFETKWLSRPENLAALADLPGQWINKVRRRRSPKTIVLDMDSSESPTYGDQEGSAYNGHPAYHRHSAGYGGIIFLKSRRFSG